MNLALFDFDGTVTHTDTFTQFIYFAVDKKRLKLGKVILLPYIIGYKMGMVSGRTIRHKIYKFGFKNTATADIKAKAEEYANSKISSFIRDNAMQRINWHRDRGDKVVIVSASLDVYLQLWCQQNKLELLCTQTESVDGILTGNFISECSSKEKVKRIELNYNLSDFDKIYAYGDTVEDEAMLVLADEAFYQYF